MSSIFDKFFGIVQVISALILILNASSLSLPLNLIYFLAISLIVSGIMDFV